MKTYDSYKKEILKKNDDIRTEYNALEEEYKIIEEKIKFKQNDEEFSYKHDKK